MWHKLRKQRYIDTIWHTFLLNLWDNLFTLCTLGRFPTRPVAMRCWGVLIFHLLGMLMAVSQMYTKTHGILQYYWKSLPLTQKKFRKYAACETAQPIGFVRVNAWTWFNQTGEYNSKAIPKHFYLLGYACCMQYVSYYCILPWSISDLEHASGLKNEVPPNPMKKWFMTYSGKLWSMNSDTSPYWKNAQNSTCQVARINRRDLKGKSSRN